MLFVRASTSSSPKCELDWPNARGSWLKDGWSLARTVVRAPTPKGPQARAKRRRDQRMVIQQLRRRAVVNFINEINEAAGPKKCVECAQRLIILGERVIGARLLFSFFSRALDTARSARIHPQRMKRGPVCPFLAPKLIMIRRLLSSRSGGQIE